MELPDSPYYSDDAVVIYCADCRDILPKLPKVDLVLADPPYNFESEGGGFYGNWHGNGHEPRQYINNLAQANCITFNPTDSIELLSQNMELFYGYFFCNKDLIDKYIQSARKFKYMFDVLVMAKHNPIPACNSHHLHDLEYIVMIREKGTSYFKSDIYDNNRKFYMTTCNGTGLHPAEKPLEFMKRMVTVSSKPGNIILDPFAGSGTTGRAAKDLGRKCILVEIEEKYCEIAAKRMSQTVMALEI